MPININGNIISSPTTNTSGVIQNYPTVIISGITTWADAGRAFSYFDSTYYDCGYGCQYYSSNPGCTNCNTVWIDMSTNYYRGILTNGPVFTNASGGYLTLDGSNDYIDFGAASAKGDTDSFTFGAWVRSSSMATKVFLARGRDGSGNGWSIYLGSDASSKTQFSVVTTSGGATSYSATGTSTIPTNTWVYLAGTWTAGSSVKVYYNGSLENTTNTTTTNLRTSTDGIIIGSLTTTAFYAHDISSFHVYTRVLSDSEILSNYNSERQRFGV